MKPNVSQLTHHVENVDETMRMTIDQDSIAHLMQILTDLYSDPILAVIREYSTNALDSHIEAGNPDPIEVTLPTQMNPELIIKDQGIGLNVDDMRDVYSMYGRSTKRSSDMVTGMLGLGCKSGLTYSLSFTVTGVRDGVKTIATVTKDSDGVGAIKVLDTVSTDEPNGVTVKIPVKPHDVHRFEQTAVELFTYWKEGQVNLVGHELSLPEDALWLDPDVAVFSKPYRQDSKIVMGGVSYPWESGIQGLSVVAWVPMGSVNFTPSREALHFTARTDRALQDIRDFVKERLVKSIEDAINAANTPFDKLKVAIEWSGHGKTLLKDHWSQSKVAMPAGRHAWDLSIGGYRGSASKIESFTLASTIPERLAIVTDYPNMTVPPGARVRIKQYVSDQGWATNVVRFVPEGTDLKRIGGREHVVKWDDVVANTDKPTLVRGGSKTVYTVHHKGGTTDVHKLDKGPIVYTTGNPRGYNHYTWSDYPDVYGVTIQTRQVEKFLRLHPKAMTIAQYREREVAKLRKKLTEADLMSAGDLYAYSGLKPHADKIDDPDLRKVIKLVGGAQSANWKKFTSLGGRVEQHAVHGQLQKRYPLLPYARNIVGNNPAAAADMIAYFNYKFNNKEG